MVVDDDLRVLMHTCQTSRRFGWFNFQHLSEDWIVYSMMPLSNLYCAIAQTSAIVWAREEHISIQFNAIIRYYACLFRFRTSFIVLRCSNGTAVIFGFSVVSRQNNTITLRIVSFVYFEFQFNAKVDTLFVCFQLECCSFCRHKSNATDFIGKSHFLVISIKISFGYFNC